MTPDEHYEVADALLEQLVEMLKVSDMTDSSISAYVAVAQVHATLATAGGSG